MGNDRQRNDPPTIILFYTFPWTHLTFIVLKGVALFWKKVLTFYIFLIKILKDVFKSHQSIAEIISYTKTVVLWRFCTGTSLIELLLHICWENPKWLKFSSFPPLRGTEKCLATCVLILYRELHCQFIWTV